MSTVSYKVTAIPSAYDYGPFDRTETVEHTLSESQAILFGMGMLFEDSWSLGGSEYRAQILLDDKIIWESDI